MRSGSPALSAIARYGVLAAFGVFLWWGRAADLDLLYAAYGFGPMELTARTAHPERFARDFPSGVENLAKAAPMHAYPLAYRFLGVPPERMVPVVLAAEMILLAIAAIVLTRTLRPEASPVVPVLVAALVLASSARDMNFGAYGQPFLWAKYHNFADAFRLFAVAAILSGRPILAGVLAAGSVLCHPTMGLMGGVFVGACALWQPRRTLGRRHLLGAGLFLAIAGAWGALVVGTGGSGGEPFPKALWFAITRMSSFHWYPIHNGLLTQAHRAAFLPFLSLLTLASFYLARSGAPGERARRVLAGSAAALALVVAGLAFSVVELSPTLIKLCLPRANGMVVTVALVYAVAGLWDDIRSAPPWRQVVAALVLASPFLSKPGFPLVFVLLLAMPAWLPACQGRLGPRWNLLALVPGAASVLGLIAWAVAEQTGPWTSSAYTGIGWLTRTPVLVGLALVTAAAATPSLRQRHLVRIAVLAVLGCGAMRWALAYRLGEEGRAWCRKYKAVQLWARENTPEDALFLLDPVIRYPGLGYGWRDYAQRSSFGMLREWLLTGWNYTSDYATCRTALERLGEFGITIDDYLGQDPPMAGYDELRADLHRRYYTASDTWRRDVARRYSIDYFVSKKLGTAATSSLPVVFENELFVIHAVRPGSEPDAPAP